jgi:hypothetical protein
LTAAIAYRDSQIPIKHTRDRSAEHDLAIVWAVTQLGDSMPATIDDRVELERARAHLSALAELLGTDEVGLKHVLREHHARAISEGGLSAAPP